jgi:hypothetical protein
MRRTAWLTIIAREFDEVRPALSRIMREVGGLVVDINLLVGSGDFEFSEPRPDLPRPGAQPRTLGATLQIPVNRLDAALDQLKALGDVMRESHTGQDITDHVADVDARLSNARNLEKRLNQLLLTRTGRVAELLEAERELARVRGDIERLDGQRRNLASRVAYAEVTLYITEQRIATVGLGTTPLATRLRNAVMDGLNGALESGLEVMLFAIRVGPTLLLWTVVVGLPAWAVWRWRRRSRERAEQPG